MKLKWGDLERKAGFKETICLQRSTMMATMMGGLGVGGDGDWVRSRAAIYRFDSASKDQVLQCRREALRAARRLGSAGFEDMHCREVDVDGRWEWQWRAETTGGGLSRNNGWRLCFVLE